MCSPVINFDEEGAENRTYILFHSNVKCRVAPGIRAQPRLELWMTLGVQSKWVIMVFFKRLAGSLEEGKKHIPVFHFCTSLSGSIHGLVNIFGVKLS